MRSVGFQPIQASSILVQDASYGRLRLYTKLVLGEVHSKRTEVRFESATRPPNFSSYGFVTQMARVLPLKQRDPGSMPGEPTNQ